MKASELEEPSPEEALGIYKELEDENSEFHTRILLAGIIFPILAFIISFVVVQYSGHRTIATVLILSVVGFAPPLLLFGTKLVEKEKRHVERARSPIEVTSVVLMAPIVIIADLITLLILVLIAGLIVAAILIPLSLFNHFLTGAPVLWPVELPMNVQLPVFLVVFVIISLFVMSEVRLRPFSIRRILSEMPVGLKINSGSILEYLASMAIGLVLVGSGSLEILYANIRHGILANGFAGLLLGSAFARGALENDFVLGNLYRIGRARCLIRLDRQAEASYRIRRLGDSPKFSRPPPINYLSIALLNLIEGFPRVEEFLNEAASESVSSEYHRYREIIADSILRTRRLAGLSDDKGIVRTMIHRQYLGIGRVLNTSYSYMEGVDPSEYDPDNPTGYMTGQWIDVEVIEGKIYFNKWFSPKEIIRGVWSYGGDVGIVGKPRVGDLVGYYEQGYAKIWEKISDNSGRDYDNGRAIE